MCLVSFVPLKNGFVITSSRDEDIGREKPTLIQNEVRNKKTLNFPRDIKGGTWIGYDDSNNFLVILNGARTKHKRAVTYRKSRGLIVLDLLDSDNLITAWQNIDLDKIEPFTLIHFSADEKLREWIWDGVKKITSILDTKSAHCWLSSTLYTSQEWSAMKTKFQQSLPSLNSPVSIRAFHLKNRYEDKPEGEIYPSVITVSNTTAYFKEGKVIFNYLDVR